MIFRLLLSTILFLSCNPAVAQVKVIEGQYGLNTQMPTNYVRNKGCFTNVANITASGGSLTRNTTTPLENGADCQVDASASAQTYTWATFALDRWLSGQNCEAKFNYRGDASLYKAYVTVNSVKASTDLQLQNSNSPSVQPVSINFACGAQPLTTALVIESTSASAAAINVAGVYVGAATNIGTVAQAKNVVQFTWSGTLTATHDVDILFTWSGATQTRLENLSHSSGVFTVLVPGDYQTKFCPRLDYNSGSASTMRAITAKVYKNSTSTPLDASGYVHGLAQNNINGGGEPSSGFYANPPPCVVTTMSLAANDTLRFKAYQANGDGSNFSWVGGTLEINYFPSSTVQALSSTKVFYPSYSATITAGASCTFSTDVVQTGSWLSSCTRNGAGDFTLNFTSGFFVAAPHCIATPVRNLANTRYTVSSWITSLTSSAVRLNWGANDDQQGTIAAAIAVADDSGTFTLTCTAREPSSMPAPVLVGGVTSKNTTNSYSLDTIRGQCSGSSVISSSSFPGTTTIGNQVSNCCDITLPVAYSNTGNTICTVSSRAGTSGTTFALGADVFSTTGITVCASGSSNYAFQLMCMGPR